MQKTIFKVDGAIAHEEKDMNKKDVFKKTRELRRDKKSRIIEVMTLFF